MKYKTTKSSKPNKTSKSNKLSKNQSEQLKLHSVHHTKKHIDEMKKLMLKGISFAQAHKQTINKIGK